MSAESYRLVDSTEILDRIGYEVVKDGICIAYYYNGTLHRDGDEPAYMDFNGTRKWYKNGLLHRISGPAIIYGLNDDSEKVYCIKGNEIRGGDLKDFKRLIEGSVEDLPLYINHPVLKEVAIEKLKGPDIEIKISDRINTLDKRV